MAKGPVTRSDILEDEYTSASGYYIGGAVLLVVSLLLIWLGGVIGTSSPTAKIMIKTLGYFGVVGSVATVVVGYMRVKRTVEMPVVSVECPYCGGATEFPDYPTEDYTCEQCHRRVYFENGQMVAVKDVECTVCKAVHKVAVTAKSYTCDRCNRTLRLDDPAKGVVATAETTVGQMFDVVLTEVGRNTTGVAMALQNVLVCNLPDARRQMQDLPLTIVKGVPERKADAVRSRFRELGATAVVRAVETESVPRA